jgi:hypothetical protein
VVKGLKARGWDVVRAIDAFSEGTDDEFHFDEAVRQGRVVVANDEDQHLAALERLALGSPFPGLVYWVQTVYTKMSDGEIIAFFGELAERDGPFGSYPQAQALNWQASGNGC